MAQDQIALVVGYWILCRATGIAVDLPRENYTKREGIALLEVASNIEKYFGAPIYLRKRSDADIKAVLILSPRAP